MQKEVNNVDITEVYSPWRVNKVASEMSLKPGWSMDLTNTDELGQPWDFSQVEMRNKAYRKIAAQKPLLLIGSPPCTDMSALQTFNFGKMDPAEVARRQEQARKHIEFCCQLYELQLQAGRFFLHEHPKHSLCWKVTAMQELLNKKKVLKVDAHMCRFGMMSQDSQGPGLVLKPTSFMTNSAYLADELNKTCSNLTGATAHRHIPVLGGRGKACQVYPDKLCKAICRGLWRQKAAQHKGEYLLATVSCETHGSTYAIPREEEEEGRWQQYFDELTGYQLDPQLVQQARKEEMQFVHKMKLYDVTTTDECRQVTGKMPIKGRWIDINKGDNTVVNYRSRYVAKEFRRGVPGGDFEMFAATPPLETLRLLLSMVASQCGDRGPQRLMVMDVSRAFFHAPATRKLYVELPDEEGLDKSKYCARLNYSLYGTRDAPMNWALTYSNHLVGLGFRKGRSSSCIFYHRERQLRVMVHGDDYVCTGAKGDLKWLAREMKKKFEIKVQNLGPDVDEQREVRVLNRIIRWTESGLEYEADPRHQEILIKALKLTDAKGVSTPGVKDVPKVPGEELPLQGLEATQYRACCARLNFLAQDRADLLYSAKEASRHMATPLQKHWQLLKRAGRHLRDQPREYCSILGSRAP